MKLRKIKRGKNKKGIELSFAWIFAFIAGAVIILLAIYATTSLIRFSQYRYYTETAAQIRNYLNPMVTGIASAESIPPIRFSRETKLYIDCTPPDSRYYFGREKLSFAEKSGIGAKWSEPGANITVTNKFIFSNEIEEGDTIYLASVPFWVGFKVDDLVLMNTDNYCFVGPPSDIENTAFVFNNVNVTNSVTECNENEITVCFDFLDPRCNMTTFSNDEYETGAVIKQDGTRLNFIGNLLYGAIFSSPETYDCNIKRLGRKIGELAWIYKEKTSVAGVRGCGSILETYLDNIAQSAVNIDSTDDLIPVYSFAQSMDEQNKRALCQVYPGEKY